MVPQPSGRPPRRGPLAWLVFLIAVAAMLALLVGCLSMIYGSALRLI